MLKDHGNLFILLAQAPLIGLMLAFFFKPQIFETSCAKYPRDATILIFLMICSCIWFGIINAIKEIVKEIPIYRRERMVNLGILPYVLSKIGVLSLFCVVQSLILNLLIFSRIKIPESNFQLQAEIWLISAVVAISGMALGLMFSALMTNTDKAVSILPLLLIPQIVFAGAILPLDGNLLKPISYLMISKFGYEALGSAVNLPGDNFMGVSVPGYMAILFLFTVIYAVVIFGMQKRKDKALD